MHLPWPLTALLASGRRVRKSLLILLDSALVLLALWLSYFLHQGTFEIDNSQFMWLGLAAPLIAIPVFVHNGLYRVVIRYLAEDGIWIVFKAVTPYLALWALVVLFSGVPEVPRAVILINWVVTLVLIGGSRFLARWAINLCLAVVDAREAAEQVRRMLIYGAGEAGIQLANGLANHGEFEVVGFIDDASVLQNQYIKGIRVYAPVDLDALIKETAATEILLAMPSVARARRTQILALLEPLSVPVRTLPDMAAIASGRVKVQDIREIDIADLLGRESVPPHPVLMRRNIEGRVVMVTGAGGSIGAELCRQIVRLAPARLVMFEQNEFNLYSIERELAASGVAQAAVLGSCCDRDYVRRQCQQYGVNTIFHAAAYKHVSLIEANPVMGAYNNVLGTVAIATAASDAGVEKFVLVSTDKAVRPANVMGATKRFAELVLQAMNARQSGQKTRFVMVRFGNVIDSSGSVIPLFRDQINAGGPVTVTHADVTRYFMTIPEAAQLVIQAGAMGEGGEVFVLDMGEAVRIYDLAVKMIKLSGLTLRDSQHPDGDIAIEFSGLRAGEKLHEELLIGDHVSTTQHARIMMANERFLHWPEISDVLTQLEAAVAAADADKIRHILVITVNS